jgi:hypothetical protein
MFADSRGLEEAVAQEVRSLLPIPIRGLLAPDTKPRPWHSREAFVAGRRFALQAGSKAALVNSPQGGSNFMQQDSFTVNVADRQIALRSILNLVHLVRAILDGDTVPPSQYQSQFGLSSFEDLLDAAVLVVCDLHGYGRGLAFESTTGPPCFRTHSFLSPNRRTNSEPPSMSHVDDRPDLWCIRLRVGQRERLDFDHTE